MSGIKLLLVTNIIIYFLRGDLITKNIIPENDIYVSIITEMELLSFSGLSKKNVNDIRNLLSTFTIINITQEIKELAIQIKQNHEIKLPDSIISATSQCLKIPTVTADKDLFAIQELEIINYSNE